MRLRYCCSLTITPDFSEITNHRELNLEGCVNLSTLHPSIGMLKKLVVLNLKDCTRVRSFLNKVEMDSLQVLNLSGCLKVDKLSEDLGKIKSLTELHVDKTAITELPSFLSSLINLESLSFGGQGRIQPRCYCNLEQVPESIGGLSCLGKLNLEGNNLVEVPESIGGLSCLEILHLGGNNFSSLPGSLSQLSHLRGLFVDGCKKLEVLAKLPPKMFDIHASDCTSLREVSVSSKGSLFNVFRNCPNLFKNVTIDSEGCIHQLSAFLGYVGLQTKRCEFFSQDSGYPVFDILYHGNSMPEWFTNRSRENHVKVELPSDWCYHKFRGYGTCVVFKCKKPFNTFEGISVKNFDGASLMITRTYFPSDIEEFLKKDVIGIQDSYMIWLHYARDTREWEEAKNFVTFSFFEEEVEVKECGVRLICDEDIEQEAESSMLQGLPTPTQHRGFLGLYYRPYCTAWSW
ncbi:NB-ARC domains-containing protein [Tanacetum coccineum]